MADTESGKLHSMLNIASFNVQLFAPKGKLGLLY